MYGLSVTTLPIKNIDIIFLPNNHIPYWRCVMILFSINLYIYTFVPDSRVWHFRFRDIRSFCCSSFVFSSSSDSADSLNVFGFLANLALLLMLDVVAWGSSEMQNSTIVRSITNQKSYFHMQVNLNCFYLLIH